MTPDPIAVHHHTILKPGVAADEVEVLIKSIQRSRSHDGDAATLRLEDLVTKVKDQRRRVGAAGPPHTSTVLLQRRERSSATNQTLLCSLLSKSSLLT